MNWEDKGIILSIRPFSESSAILSVLTENHGRHNGLARSAYSAQGRAIYQPGNAVNIQWHSRLEEQLGTFKAEVERPWASLFMEEQGRLSALLSALSLLAVTLPEREPAPVFYHMLNSFISSLDQEIWQELYLFWELNLLAQMGFALDFSHCAATGVVENLVYVSPKSGRAVSLAAGAPYKEKLLPLPRFLKERSVAESKDLLQGLTLTGYFIEKHLFHPLNKESPPARDRLFHWMKQKAERETHEKDSLNVKA